MNRKEVLADWLCNDEKSYEDILDSIIVITPSYFKYEDVEYLVLDDEEISDRQYQYGLELLEQELLNVPQHLREYFNTDAYVWDNTDIGCISESYYETEDYTIFELE